MTTPSKERAAKAITDQLLKLAVEKIKDDEGGKVHARTTILARLIWERALGYAYINEQGKKKIVPPATWAINLILERMEGKVGPSDTDKSSGTSVGENVRRLAKEMLNEMTDHVTK